MNHHINGASHEPPGFEVLADSPRQRTVGMEIRHWAELQPNSLAVAASGFAPLSYRELQCLIDQICAALRLAGFSRNARIAVAMRDGPQAALAIVAVACSAVCIPLNPRQTLSEIETRFDSIRPDALFVDSDADCALRRVAERKDIKLIEVTHSVDGKLGFGIASKTSAAATPNKCDDPDPDALAIILQTSGTTAEPKLIPISHRIMVVAAERARVCYQLTPLDRSLSVSPIWYGYGLRLPVFVPLQTGGSVAFPANPIEVDLSEWLIALKPTWYSAGPTLHLSILERMETQASTKTMHSLRFIVTGGAALPEKVYDRLQLLAGVPVLEHYGASETSAISSNQPPPGPFKPGTCGIPWPNTVSIIGDDGQQVGAGEQGEIFVGGATVISGYLNAPALNRARFVNGWFKTGDIGCFDEDGFLTLHGRKDDLINRGGEKISPVEIEDALIQHPAVAEAAAFGIPHPRLGEDVAAAVVLRPGMMATPDELRTFLDQHISSFKIPRRPIILSHLPKGATGKILRRELADSFVIKHDAARTVAETDHSHTLLIQLRGLWESLLNSGPISIDDDFFDLGGDSLLAQDMLNEIERMTGKNVPISHFFDAFTIRKLAQKLSGEGDLNAKSLIEISPNGARTPLFFFHGDFVGGGRYVKKLAHSLGPDQPLMVIAPPGVDGRPIPHSIEAMAAEHLPLIMNTQPKGPYRLAGFCVGGLVAFETGRMLLEAGRKIDLIIMVDSPAVNARRSVQALLSLLARTRPALGPAVDRLMARVWFNLATADRFTNLSALRLWVTWLKGEVRATAVSCIRRLFSPRPINRSSGPDGDSCSGRESMWGHVDGGPYRRVLSNYFPSPIPAQVVFLQFEYNGDPWRRMSTDSKVIRLPGDHESIISSPTDFALHLDALLRKGDGVNSQRS